VATGGWSSIRYGNGFFNLVTTASAGTAPALFANTYWPTLSDRYETIGHWADKSGTGRHFSATVAGYTDRPLFLPTLSALYFNGSTTYLTLTSDIPYTAQTTILVMRPRNVNVWRSVYTQTQLPSADNIIYSPLRYRVNGGTAPSINHYEVYQDRPGLGRVDGAATFKGSRRPDQYDIVTCVHTGTNVYIRSNNSLGSYTGGQLNLNHTMNVSRIGAAISGNLSPININYTYAELDLSEVIVYNRALTNPELEDINYYLARKWYHIHRLFRPTYPVVNSLLSDMSTFSISGEPVPFNQLLPECDTIFTNYKTITADVDLNITGRWGFFLPSVINSPMGSITKTGGNVVLANNVTISADFFQNTAACFVTLLPRASATIVGNLSAGTYGSTTNGAVLSGTDVQSLNLIGNISGRDLVQDHNGSTAVGVYWRSTQTLNITGNILPTTWSTTMIQNVSTGTVNVYGDILMHRGSRDQDVHTGIRNDSAGAIWLFGNINHPNMQVVGSGATAIINNSTGSVYVSGNIWAGKKNNYTGYGITNVSTGTVQVTGNVYGGGCWTPASNPNNAIGIYQTGNGVVRVLGNVYSLEDIYDTYSNHGVAITTGRLMVDCEVIETDGRKSSAIYSTSTNPVSVINVQKVLNSKSGGQAINAYKVQIIPSSSTPTYINHSTGPDTEPVKYWTANTTFTYPDSADVRSGTIYNNNTLTGVMVVPPQSSVFLGVPIDLQNVIASQIIPNNYYQIVTLGTTNYLNLGASENTPGTYFTATNPGSGSGTVSMVGTAFISPQSIWNTQISTLPNYDSTSSKILTNTLTTHELTALRTGIGFRAAPKISLFSFTDFWGDLLQWNDEVVFESLDDLQPLKIQGLQLWLDGSDSSTVYTDDGKNLATNNGDIIYRWSDKSGNDNHAIQPIVVNRPLLNIKTNGINYKNTLTFDGVDDSLAANIPGYRNFTALTIIGVISTTLSAAPNTVTMSIGSHGNIGTSANGYPGNKGLGIASFTSGLPNETITILAENATANSGRLGSSTYMRAANTVQAIHVELNNTGTNMYTNNIATILDQTLQITSSTNITPNQYGYTLDDIFNIGALRANGNLTQHTNQKFAELLIYNRVLTNTERTNLWAYLQAKWNII
jgi:hypothetical protein